MKTALIHRYDDARDMAAVREFLCSEVYGSSRKFGNKFDLVIIVPTVATGIKLALYADAVSGQMPTYGKNKPWPSNGGPYHFRIELENVRTTSVNRVKRAAARLPWGTSWRVNAAIVDESILEVDELDLLFEM